MQQVSTHVWVETGYRGCNVGAIASDEGIAMVDSPMYPSDATRWRQAALAWGIPRYLIHTEHHVDHIISDFLFPEATVVGQRYVREDMATTDTNYVHQRVREQDLPGVPFMKNYRMRLPSITFDSEMDIHLGNLHLQVLSLPGHCRGETAIYVPQERVAFVGDNVFHKVQTFLHQALPEEWLQSLDRIAQLDVDVIVPGHGEICDKSYLPEQRAFIQEWIDTIKRAIAQGWTREEAKQRISFKDRYPMGIGSEARANDVQLWNVERLYTLYGGPP